MNRPSSPGSSSHAAGLRPAPWSAEGQCVLTRGRHHPRAACHGEWWLPQSAHQRCGGLLYQDQVGWQNVVRSQNLNWIVMPNHCKVFNSLRIISSKTAMRWLGHFYFNFQLWPILQLTFQSVTTENPAFSPCDGSRINSHASGTYKEMRETLIMCLSS